MRMTLFAAVLALVVSACSPGDGSSETTDAGVLPTTSTLAPGLPVVGDVATVAVVELPTTLNPVAPGGTLPASTTIQQATLPGAYVLDPDTWTAVPRLVTRIPSGDDVVLDRDRQTVTWTIRDDAVWSDGTPVSGSDFDFTLRAALGLTECGGSQFAGSIFGLEVVSVEAKSITVEMPGPTTGYATMFPTVLPAHAANGATVCDSDGVGWPSAGPYIANEITDTVVSIRRNDAYWGDTPALGGIDFVPADASAAADGFGSDAIDVATTSSSGAAADFERSGATVTTLAAGHVEHLAFNFATGRSTEQELLGLPEFRQAVAAAVDRVSVADSVGWVPVSSLVPGHGSPWSGAPQGVEAAMALLASACESIRRDCVAEPPSLRLVATNFGERPTVVARVVADLEAAGIDVIVGAVASAELDDELRTGTWDVAVLPFNAAAGVSATAESLLSAFSFDGLGNVYNYGGSGSLVATDRSAFELRLFLGQMDATADLDRSKELIGEVHALLAEHMVVIPLVAQPRHTAVATDRLQGVVANATPSGVTWNVAEWSYTDE